MNSVQKLYRLLKEDFPGESDEQIAQRIGLTSGGISGWKNGTAQHPRTDKVVSVAEVTGRNAGELLAWLYGDEGRKPPKGRPRYDPEAPPP